jgi:hypothetical protein
MDYSEALSMVQVNLSTIEATVGKAVFSILVSCKNRDQSACFTTQFFYCTLCEGHLTVEIDWKMVTPAQIIK